MEISKRDNFVINLVLGSIFFSQYIEFAVVFFVTIFFLKFKTNFKLILLGLIISSYSIIMIIINNYNLSHFFIRGLSCILIVIFYFSFVENYMYFIPYIWDKYYKMCYLACNIGIFQVIISIIFKINIFYLFNSYPMYISGLYQPPTATLLETADFACLLTPGLVYGLLKAKSLNEISKKTWLIFLTIILCFSSLSVLGIVAFLIICLFKQFRKKTNYSLIWIASFSIIIGILLFSENVSNQEISTKDANNRDFKSVLVKFNQSINALQHIDDISTFQDYNLSTFATLSNINAAIQAPNRLFGTGLGTHEDNYIKVYANETFGQMDRAFGLNSEDGYSLFTRLLSETGIFGLMFYLLFVYKRLDILNPISVSILVSIIMHLVGNGNYFINGFVLFNVIYYKSFEIKGKDDLY